MKSLGCPFRVSKGLQQLKKAHSTFPLWVPLIREERLKNLDRHRLLLNSAAASLYFDTRKAFEPIPALGSSSLPLLEEAGKASST
jgi:hypothetical protein